MIAVEHAYRWQGSWNEKVDATLGFPFARFAPDLVRVRASGQQTLVLLARAE